jgi:glycerol kinase
MQFQADISEALIRRPVVRETTALGAAYLAGLAVGFWKDPEEVRAMWKCDTTFAPAMEGAKREELLAGWHKAVGRSRDWAK